MSKFIRAIINSARKEGNEAYPYLAFLAISLIIAMCAHYQS